MTRSTRALAILFLAALAPPARGDPWSVPRDEVSNELWLVSGPVSPSSRRTGQVGNALGAAFGVARGLTLDLELGATWLRDANTPLRSQAGQRSDTILDLGAALTWEGSEHLALIAVGGWSPRARVIADSAIAYTSTSGAPTTAEALVAADSSSSSAEVGVSWDTAGDSDFETGVDLGLAGRRYDTRQAVVLLQGPGGQAVTPQQLEQDLGRRCQAPGRAASCPRQLLALLRQQPATALNQLALRAAVAETLWLDTDVGLAGRWYLYDRDPTAVGFFRLAAAGGGGAEFGAGIPLAPLAWSVRPWMARRLGRLLVRAWWEHGTYVQDQGSLDTFALRVQYRFGSAFRAWIGGSVQRERDPEGGAATLRSGALGAMFRW
jgi:hypothetical protein